MATINRKDIRTALKNDIVASVTAAKLVMRYLGDPGRKFPAITIASRGTGGNPLTSDGDTLRHRFYVHLLVLAGSAEASWTKEQAEDLLDDTRKAFDDYLELGTFAVSGLRFQVKRDGDSEVLRSTIGKEQYLDEPIPVLVETFYP